MNANQNPTQSQIRQAVRQASRQVLLNATDRKVTKALELLGVEHEQAHNHGLACFDSKSLAKSVARFFEKSN